MIWFSQGVHIYDLFALISSYIPLTISKKSFTPFVLRIFLFFSDHSLLQDFNIEKHCLTIFIIFFAIYY